MKPMVEFALIVALIVLGIVAQAATLEERDGNGWGTGPMEPSPREESWEWGKPSP